MTWRVWLADGSTMSSREHAWEDVPDRILVLRTWNPNRVLWGDSHYGRPDTLKGSSDVSDAVFARALAEAQAATRPSERGEAC